MKREVFLKEPKDTKEEKEARMAKELKEFREIKDFRELKEAKTISIESSELIDSYRYSENDDDEKLSKPQSQKTKGDALKVNRKLHKDCIIGKIRTRFFKFFVNQYMITFANFMNSQKIITLSKNIYFIKLKKHFLVNSTVKQNKKWDFINKTIFELFIEHSDMNLQEINEIMSKDKGTFNKLTEKLDKTTVFVIFKPIKEVYQKFLENKTLVEGFLGKVKIDLDERNQNTKEFEQEYFKKFEDCTLNFINYYLKR